MPKTNFSLKSLKNNYLGLKQPTSVQARRQDEQAPHQIFERRKSASSAYYNTAPQLKDNVKTILGVKD